jgi:hypothetical protein
MSNAKDIGRLGALLNENDSIIGSLNNTSYCAPANSQPEEVITHEGNGLLVDFFSSAQIVDTVHRVCEDRSRMGKLREQARRTIVDRYDLKSVCLPRQRELIESSLFRKLGKGD